MKKYMKYLLILALILPSLALADTGLRLKGPTDQTANSGATATFSVEASGADSFIYQWQTNKTYTTNPPGSATVPFYDIPGATGRTYTTDPVHFNMNGQRFRVGVSRADGTESSWDLVSDEVRLITHTLFTSISPYGVGAITRSPVVVAPASYATTTIVILTAVPNSGYEFDFWSGDASGNQNPVNVSMEKRKIITANFRTATTPTSPVDQPASGGSSGGARGSSGGQHLTPEQMCLANIFPEMNCPQASGSSPDPRIPLIQEAIRLIRAIIAELSKPTYQGYYAPTSIIPYQPIYVPVAPGWGKP